MGGVSSKRRSRDRLGILVLTVSLAASAWSAAQAQNCSQTSVGLTPINDLGTGLYQGEQGGLYPGGSNVRPPGYESQMEGVVPLGPDGSPDPSGWIVLMSIGMSNTRREFEDFVNLAAADPELNPRLNIVNTAMNGQSAGVISDPAAQYWNDVDAMLAANGLTPEQAQVIWLKEARRAPTEPFPTDANNLLSDLRSIVQIIGNRYPNTKAIYVSSRIYAGYAITDLSPEPHAYHGGFAFKWLVEERIGGSLNSPWISWGPYLWADGLTPRSDGLIWECQDFDSDGTHPSSIGEQKVADMLMTFFKTDATTATWFLAAIGPPQNLRRIDVRR